MPDIAIIQLLPDKPMSAADFTNALNGLVIRMSDRSSKKTQEFTF